MQVAFTVLLTGILIAAVITFAVITIVRVRRTSRTAREAGEMEMRFSPEDPFDVPRRYADFALIGGGHSPKADNVTHGRIGGRYVRAFDFRYEVAHGTHRITRHYAVVIVELHRALPEVLMWNDDDTDSAPLQVRCGGGRIGCWSYRGEEELGRTLLEAAGGVADMGTSMQTCGNLFMLFAPVRRRRIGTREWIGEAVGAAEFIDPST